MIEAAERFHCYGSQCCVLVIGPGGAGTAQQAARQVRRRLLRWHERFSRFLPESELSRVNADPRARMRVTGTMARLAEAAVWAAEETGGLVDSTLVAQIERAGYASDLGDPLPLADAFRLAPVRRPATSSGDEWWRDVRVDRALLALERPPGLLLDSGGLAKGLFADLAADLLADHESFAIDCGGDIRLGGAGGVPRAVDVVSPFADHVLHRYELVDGGVATSGIGKRSWPTADGAVGHHLLDPATGEPAFTGVVQVTALAPTATEAEALSKAALLRGPAHAGGVLVHGGVVVLDDGSFIVLDPGS